MSVLSLKPVFSSPTKSNGNVVETSSSAAVAAAMNASNQMDLFVNTLGYSQRHHGLPRHLLSFRSFVMSYDNNNNNNNNNSANSSSRNSPLRSLSTNIGSGEESSITPITPMPITTSSLATSSIIPAAVSSAAASGIAPHSPQQRPSPPAAAVAPISSGHHFARRLPSAAAASRHGLATPSTGRVRRRLFPDEPIDHEQVARDLQASLTRIEQESEAKWNFDFATGQPKNEMAGARWEWAPAASMVASAAAATPSSSASASTACGMASSQTTSPSSVQTPIKSKSTKPSSSMLPSRKRPAAEQSSSSSTAQRKITSFLKQRKVEGAAGVESTIGGELSSSSSSSSEDEVGIGAGPEPSSPEQSAAQAKSSSTTTAAAAPAASSSHPQQTQIDELLNIRKASRLECSTATTAKTGSGSLMKKRRSTSMDDDSHSKLRRRQRLNEENAPSALDSHHHHDHHRYHCSPSGSQSCPESSEIQF